MSQSKIDIIFINFLNVRNGESVHFSVKLLLIIKGIKAQP